MELVSGSGKVAMDLLKFLFCTCSLSEDWEPFGEMSSSISISVCALSSFSFLNGKVAYGNPAPSFILCIMVSRYSLSGSSRTLLADSCSERYLVTSSLCSNFLEFDWPPPVSDIIGFIFFAAGGLFLFTVPCLLEFLDD
jgi:hypothetical protein